MINQCGFNQSKYNDGSADSLRPTTMTGVKWDSQKA